VGLALVAAMAPAGAQPPIQGAVQHFTPVEPPQPAPEVVFTTLLGAPATLKAQRGKVVLLNFWATWCAPCIRELPTLDRLQAWLGGRDFTVVLASIDRGGAHQVSKFLKNRPLLEKLESHLDPKMQLARALNVRQMPTTVLIDKTGQVVGRLDGVAEWDTPDAEALIRYYIREGTEG